MLCGGALWLSEHVVIVPNGHSAIHIRNNDHFSILMVVNMSVWLASFQRSITKCCSQVFMCVLEFLKRLYVESILLATKRKNHRRTLERQEAEGIINIGVVSMLDSSLWSAVQIIVRRVSIWYPSFSICVPMWGLGRCKIDLP